MICPECGGDMKQRRAGRPDTCGKCGHKGSVYNVVSAPEFMKMDFSVDGGTHKKRPAKKKRKKKGKK